MKTYVLKYTYLMLLLVNDMGTIILTENYNLFAVSVHNYFIGANNKLLIMGTHAVL